MLTALKHKACPMISLLLFTVACGKGTSAPSSATPVVELGQITSDELTVKVNTASGLTSDVKIPCNGKVNLPQALRVRSGSASGKKASIYYNMDPHFTLDDYEFRCDYKASGTDKLTLVDCYDMDNRPFGNVGGIKFSIDAGKLIRMKVTSTTSSAAEIEATYLVDWK
jgi:hypothetical protein